MWLYDGLVAYYGFDEGSGTILKNKISGTRTTDGTINGATWEYGRSRNYCLNFDGVDDYVEIAHDSNQLLTTGGTISAWIKAGSAGEANLGKIVDKATGANNGENGWTFGTTTTNRLFFKINGSAAIVSATNSVIFGDGNWYHALVTWNASGYSTIYVNGVQSGTQGITGDPTGITTTNTMRIGMELTATNRAFNGSIDEVMIWNRALSQEEITVLYQKFLKANTLWSSNARSFGGAK